MWCAAWEYVILTFTLIFDLKIPLLQKSPLYLRPIYKYSLYITWLVGFGLRNPEIRFVVSNSGVVLYALLYLIQDITLN